MSFISIFGYHPRLHAKLIHHRLLCYSAHSRTVVLGKRLYSDIQVKLSHKTPRSPSPHPAPLCPLPPLSQLFSSEGMWGESMTGHWHMCPSKLEVKSLLVRKAFNQICICFLFLLSGLSSFSCYCGSCKGNTQNYNKVHVFFCWISFFLCTNLYMETSQTQ